VRVTEHKIRKNIAGPIMNRTGDLSLCRWTTFQYTTKANGDIGLAVVFKLLYITT